MDGYDARTTFTLQNSMNAASSRVPRSALLNFDTTSSSPRSKLANSCFHIGRSRSCPDGSSMTCTHPYWRIHSLSLSYSPPSVAMNMTNFCHYNTIVSPALKMVGETE